MRFGTINGELASVYPGTTTLPNSYAAGGFDIAPDVPGTVIDVMMSPAASGGSIYTFEYDSGTDKVLVYDDGTEVTATTDLTSLGAQRYLAVASEDAERCLFHALDERLLESVTVSVSGDVTADSSNYWSIGLQRVDDRNVEIAALSTSSLTLSAKEQVTLYEPDGGLSLNPGDDLRLKIASTGQPTALVDLAVLLQFRRRVV